MVVFSHLGVFSLKKNFVVFPALVLGMAVLASAQTPVLWEASAIDITSDNVKLYDQASPGTAAAPAGGAPATSRPATTPAPTPAPKKK